MLHLDGLYNISEGCLTSPTTPAQAYDFSCQAPDPAGTITTENYEHDVISEEDFLGSSNGIHQVCFQGQAGVTYIDFARSSRGSKTTDCKGLHFVAYARDGISVEASDTAAPLSGIHAMSNQDPLCTANTWCITQTQLKAIYGSCTLDNWNNGAAAGAGSLNIGGNASVIQVYTPQSGSGTRSQFETFLGIADSSACLATYSQPASHATVPENVNTGIVAADIPTFIFPFSYAIFHTEVNSTNTVATNSFLLASIDNVLPTTVTIANGSFPYSRYIYNVFCASTAAGTCGDPLGTGHLVTQKTVDYVGEEGWICKPGVQENAAWVGNGNVPALDAAQPNAQAPHSLSPHYNANWSLIIAAKIKSRGFGALALGVIGNGDLNSDHCRLFVT